MLSDLANHVWQSSVFAAGIWLLTLAVRRNHARVRYWLWLAASVKFLLPLTVLASLGQQVPWAPDTQHRWSTAAVAVAQISEPFSEAIVTAAPAPSTAEGPARRQWAWQTIVYIVWGLGVAAIAVVRIQLWRRLRRLVGVSTPADIVAVELPSAVQVRAVPGVLEPGVIGIVRPILLLPSGIQDYLTPRQLQAVIAHELCHVRRRDNLTAAIHMLAEGVFWFHPLVWWIGGQLVDARERACDEDVLHELGDPDAYAEGILNVCKLYVRAPLACVSGVSGADLQTRLEAIVSNRRSRRLTAAKAVALVVAGVLGISLPVGLGAIAHPRTSQSVGPDVELSIPSPPPQVSAFEPRVLLPAAAPSTAPRRVQAPPVVTPAAASPGQAQLPDAFRISGWPNRAQNRVPADPGLERQLEEAFLSGRSFADLSLTADVTFRQLNRAEYAVPVSVRIAPANELTVGRGERSRLDFLAAVTDPFGTTVANMRDAAELTLDAAAIPALAKTPIIYDTSFTLLPGRYELKILARDQTTGRIGSTTVSFRIPNLNREQQQ